MVRALGEPAPSGWLAQSMQQALAPQPVDGVAGIMARAPARPDVLYGTPQAAGYANADEYAQRFRGANRQAVGGIAQGVANLPADVVETPLLLAQNGSYVGNANTGDLRYDPNTRSAASYVREYVVDPLRAGAAKIGDAIAGGAPVTQEQADARLAGVLTGNVGIWEAAPRSLMALNAIRKERNLLNAPGLFVDGKINEPVFQRLMQELPNRADGFTFDPRTGEMAQSGIMVGGHPAQVGGGNANPISLADEGAMRNFLLQNRDALSQPGVMFGGWGQPEGMIIDLANDARTPENAQRLMNARNEKAAFNLDNFEEIANPYYNEPRVAEVAIGRDAAGNVVTNAGRTIRDPNPPVAPRSVLPNRPAPSPIGSLAFDRPMLDAAGNVQPRSLLRIPENAAQPIPRPNPVYPTGPRGEAPPAPAGFDAPPPPRLLSRETKTVPDQTAAFGNRDEHIVRFALPNGDEANVVYSVDGKNLRVHFVGSTGGEGSVGAQGIASIRDQLAAAHPDVTSINGRRISGARIAGGRGPGEGSIDVNRRGQGGTQTLGGMVVGGAGGAVAGAQVGDTPEERLRNSLLGLGGGMILGGGGALGLTTREVGEAEAAGLLRNELGAAGRAGRRYDLVHMSPERLTTIDPKYAGTGTVMRGAERRRGGVPKSYYFVKGSGRFEDAFDPRRYGRNLVRHDVSARLNLYDPSKPVESITRAYQRGGPDAFEKALKKAGYNGYLSVPDADSEYAQVAAVFDALPVGGGRRGLRGNRRGAVGATPSIFDRSAPSLQGTATPDPRLFSAMPRGEPSELSQAIANSRVVERGLQKDAEAGLSLGGESWYEPGPLVQFLGERAGPEAFRDWTIARGTGSIRSPTDTEITNASALLYGRRHGINDIRELSAEHQRLFPNERRLRLIPETHGPNFERAMADMGNFPTTPGSPDRKVPWYSFGNMGGGGEGTSVPLDTHERLRLLQLANDDRKIRPLLREAGLEPRALGKVRGGAEVPIKNALDYDALSQPYQRIARRMGLLSPQQAQASRWIGGAGATGLRSERYGDFTQTLEDMVYQTALQRGLPTDPKSLRELALKIMTGETISVVPSGFAKSYSGQRSLF